MRESISLTRPRPNPNPNPNPHPCTCACGFTSLPGCSLSHHQKLSYPSVFTRLRRLLLVDSFPSSLDLDHALRSWCSTLTATWPGSLSSCTKSNRVLIPALEKNRCTGDRRRCGTLRHGTSSLRPWKRVHDVQRSAPWCPSNLYPVEACGIATGFDSQSPRGRKPFPHLECNDVIPTQARWCVEVWYELERGSHRIPHPPRAFTKRSRPLTLQFCCRFIHC